MIEAFQDVIGTDNGLVESYQLVCWRVINSIWKPHRWTGTVVYFGKIYLTSLKWTIKPKKQEKNKHLVLGKRWWCSYLQYGNQSFKDISLSLMIGQGHIGQKPWIPWQCSKPYKQLQWLAHGGYQTSLLFDYRMWFLILTSLAKAPLATKL